MSFDSPSNLIAGPLGILFGFLFGKMWFFFTVNIMKAEGKQKKWGYHFHHSLFFLIPFVGSFFVLKNAAAFIFLMGIALGIIFEHRIAYGKFLFLEKIS